MKNSLTLLFIFLNLTGFSQNRETDKILEEGKLLFRAEKGAWYGTDDMLERYNAKKDSIGGYLSYETPDSKINTIFFSKYDSNDILIRYQFDSIPKQTPIKIEALNLFASEIEKDLIAIRQDAKEKAMENKDSLFSFYENTSLNFIPIIKNNKKKVFIITASRINGSLFLGNDYVLDYNSKNQLKSISKIHNTILQFQFKAEEDEKVLESTFHSHILSDYISSTDICTLLLYKDLVEWKQHIVISEKKVSIFNLENESLFTMKTKDWKKMSDSRK